MGTKVFAILDPHRVEQAALGWGERIVVVPTVSTLGEGRALSSRIALDSPNEVVKHWPNQRFHCMTLPNSPRSRACRVSPPNCFALVVPLRVIGRRSSFGGREVCSDLCKRSDHLAEEKYHG